jgi:hypothetical protein
MCANPKLPNPICPNSNFPSTSSYPPPPLSTLDGSSPSFFCLTRGQPPSPSFLPSTAHGLLPFLLLHHGPATHPVFSLCLLLYHGPAAHPVSFSAFFCITAQPPTPSFLSAFFYITAQPPTPSFLSTFFYITA